MVLYLVEMILACVNAILDGFVGFYRNAAIIKRIRKELVTFEEMGILVHLHGILLRETFLELHFYLIRCNIVVSFPGMYPFRGMEYYVEHDYVPNAMEVAKAIHVIPTDTGNIIAEFLKQPIRTCLKKYLYTQHRRLGNLDRANYIVVNYTKEISPYNWSPGCRFLHQWNTIEEWLGEL